jgi:23S rRNA pseudouridine1911/1915/1917 synthase
MATILDSIIFEDDYLLAVVKPFGMLTQSDRTGELSIFDLAQNYVTEKRKRAGDDYLGLVHRLDRPVGGVILFARTLKTTKSLSEMFRERKVKKCILHGLRVRWSYLQGSLTMRC